MGKLFVYLLRTYLFWLVFFFVNRLLFATYNYAMVNDQGIAGLLPAFFYGIRLDLAMAAYLIVLPTLFYLFRVYTGAHFFSRLNKWYFVTLVVLISLICTVDMQIFREWGNKINAQVIGYMKYPREALASSASSPVLLLLLLMLVQVLAGVFLFRKLVKPAFEKQEDEKNPVQKLAIAFAGLMAIALSVVLMRGGFQLAPLNQSFVYYSSSSGANQCAVNTTWNLFYYLSNSGIKVDERKYCLLEKQKADSIFNALYAGKENKGPDVLSTRRPNIVLIILESFTADAVSAMGGEKLSPNIDRLVSGGLLFDSIYASGDRTDKGLAAILSAFPSQPASSIITEPSGLHRMQFLPNELEKAGYQSSFLYGGETEFANMKAYLFQCGYKRIVDKFSFSQDEMNSKWGAHDEVVFNRSLNECSASASPFFHTLLTLSSHEPFEVPGFNAVKGKDETSLFRNSLVYTDSCLGDYLEKASRQPWFANTLFVIVADHGHRLIGNYNNNFSPGKFRIPLLLYGGALDEAYRGKRIHSLGSQTDIAATLLHSLGLASPFRFSYDLLDTSREGFAFYSYNDGMGWIRRKGALAYDFVSQSVNYKEGRLEHQFPEEAKAYMQKVMEDYLSLIP